MSIEKNKDMLYMERPKSKRHAPMPLENRAAQFAPFAALTGYDDAVDETARLTTAKVELSEEMKEELDIALAEIESRIGDMPRAAITYFVPDLVKEGGEYITITADVRKVDYAKREIILKDKSTIAIDDVMSITVGEN